ncbi:MAG: DUF131 domain-containing protein [Methanomethylovorans sp.]|jgi:uncharacterized protein (TIGR00304 family)|nr:DUF131 domain-containing protein [Methanomethylovorans sp.]
MSAQMLIFMGIICIFLGSLIILIGKFYSTREFDAEPVAEPFEYNVNNSKISEHDDIEHIYNRTTDKFTQTDVRGGGVIMLGPIPIILGTDIESVKMVIILAIILMLMVFLFFR